jgi:hypothetical protein
VIGPAGRGEGEGSLRSLAVVTQFFDGLHVMAPGVTDINFWPAKATGPRTPLTFYGGAAGKP